MQVRIRPAAGQAPLPLLTAERDHPITDICTVVCTAPGAKLIKNGFSDASSVSSIKHVAVKNDAFRGPV